MTSWFLGLTEALELQPSAIPVLGVRLFLQTAPLIPLKDDGPWHKNVI